MRTATERQPATTEPGREDWSAGGPAGNRIGRRQLLGLGAAGAAAGLLAVTIGPGGLEVRAADPSGTDPGSGRSLDPEHDPVQPEGFLVPLLPHAKLVCASFSAFVACDYTPATLSYAYDGIPAAARGTVYGDHGWLHAPIDLPAGARIVRVDVFGRRTSAGVQSWKLQAVPVFSIDIADPVIDLATITTASTTGPTHGAQAPVDPIVVYEGWGYSLVLLGTSPQNQAAGFLVQYMRPLVELAGDGTAIVGASGETAPPADPGSTGVYGYAAASARSRGVVGRTLEGHGVSGVATAGMGVHGEATEGQGVHGYATTGTAGHFETADATSGYALRVVGRVKLDTCAGITTISSGSRGRTVAPGINLTSASAVVATLQGSAGGTTTVHRVVVNTTANTFKIYLTKAATRDVKVAWHVFG